MQIALCATKETIAQLWKSSIELTKHKKEILRNEDELLSFLSANLNKVDLVCLEDIWISHDENELKDLIVALKDWYPNLKIMILSQEPNYIKGRELLNLGVKGYGNARMLSIHFNDALNCIEKGDIWMYPEFVQMMIKTIKHTNSKPKIDILKDLTSREKQIALLVHEGHTNKEIAEFLNITLRTVKAHTSSIYEKLNIKDRIALVLLLNEQ